jgi:hypothetical protein
MLVAYKGVLLNSSSISSYLIDYDSPGGFISHIFLIIIKDE